MNTTNDEPTIEHGATVYDGDEVALTAATVRHVLRTPETGSFLRGDWTGYVNGRLVWRSRRGGAWEFVYHWCVFRSKPITDSGATRSPIPAQADH